MSPVIRLSVIAMGALLAACSNGPSLIVLKNPQTGELVQCRGATASAIAAARDAERCARAYEGQGYQRLPS